jgi:hypothetical protein
MELLYSLPYVTGHGRVTQKFGIGGGEVGSGEENARVKYRYRPLQRVTAPMAQKQEVSFYWKRMEAFSSTQAMTYVKCNDITDLNATRNTS